MVKADMNQDADKLRSALHEVFAKIDEEYVLLIATVGRLLEAGYSF